MTMPDEALESELSGPERSAILIMYLGQDVAKNILRRMTVEDVRKVGLAMAEIERVDAVVIEKVVADFIRDLHEVSLMPRSGEEFVNVVLPELLDEDRRREIIPMLTRRVSTHFEQFVEARPPGAIAALLEDEHPQTQAVALALMGPDNASRVLRMMDPELQADVTLRMARLRWIPGELADDVQHVLKTALARAEDHLPVGGVDRTARMLGKLQRSENDRVLELLSGEDENLADQLRRRMVVFEDLIDLDNRSVQAILKHIERDDLITALKGASPTMVDKFLSNVSRRAAEDMRDEMEVLGMVPKFRARTAQENIVAAAMKLADEGTIYLPMWADAEEG